MYLNETYSEVCMHKHWFELSSLNGLKQVLYHYIVSLKYAIRDFQKQENLKSSGHLNS